MRIKYLIPFLVLVLIFGLIGCTNPCESKESKEYLKDASKKYEIFFEKFKLADSTSRMNLTPVINDMQNIKIEFDELITPIKCEELINAHDLYLEGMDLVIDGFLSFQSQEDDSDTWNKFLEAEVSFNNADIIIGEFENGELFLDARLEYIDDSVSESQESIEPKLKLLDYNFSREYDYITVEGQVENISNENLENVEAVVKYFDENDNYIKSDSGLIEYNPILSAQISSFKIITTDNPEIERYRVSFKYLSGGKINCIKE